MWLRKFSVLQTKTLTLYNLWYSFWYRLDNIINRFCGVAQKCFFNPFHKRCITLFGNGIFDCITIYFFSTKLKTFSIRLRSGLRGDILNYTAPILPRAVLAALEFWLGSPSWTNTLPVGLQLLLKISRKLFSINSANNLPLSFS